MGHLVSLALEQLGYIAGLSYMKPMIFSPSTDPTPPPPTPLLLFIQRAQLALLYPEGTESAEDPPPAAPDLRDAA